MASIQKRNSSFRVRITRQGKSTLCATFYNRLEALQWAKQTEAQLRLGLYEEPLAPAKTQSGHELRGGCHPLHEHPLDS
jgi:hypothetical protein